MKWLKESKRVVITTNNYCNLQCPRCVTGCDKIGHEWNKDGPWEVDLEDVRLLLDKIGEHIPEIRLLGGEVTAMPLDKVKALIDLIVSYDIPLSILTNGYKILNLDKEYLTKFEYIVLDGHGINEDHLDNIEVELKKMEILKVHRLKRYDYFDVEFCAEHLPKTEECIILNGLIGFYKGTLYPCCCPYYNKEDIGSIMGSWNVHSPEFINVVSAYDLPEAFWTYCYNSCTWRTPSDERPTIDIRPYVTGVP